MRNGLKIVEDGKLSGVNITRDGFLAANVKCARTGIQEYRGTEVGLDTNQIFRVWRPEDEVFSEDSINSYAGKPATDDHPDVLVDRDNWKDLAVGNIGTKVLRSGDFVNVDLVLMDGKAIDKVQAGKVELSMGYLCDWDTTPGITPEGEPYDAIQRNLRMNHIALVDKGRAGSAVRIGDSWSSERKTIEQSDTPTETPTMTLKNIVVDGLTVETTDAAEKAIVKLQGQINDANTALDAANAANATALTDAKAAHDTAIAAKDTELATKDTEIAELNKQIVSDAELDQRVAQRSELIGKAKAFTGDAELDGKTTIEIKTMAVDAFHESEFCKDKSPAYIEGAFDALKMPEPKTDEFRNVVKSITPTNDSANDNGQSAYEKRLQDGWKTNGAQA